MRILEFDKTKRTARLKMETPMDIWRLGKIIGNGDLVTARTLRTIFVQRGDERIKGSKKFLVLTIKVEKSEFSEMTNQLRLVGKIVEGPEDVQKGSYHTIEVGTGKMLTVEKTEWNEEQLRNLEKAKTKIDFVHDFAEMDELNVHLAKDDGLAAYGFEQVKLASSIGAVKKVFVSEEKIKEKNVEELLEEISEKRGEVRIVSRKYPFGEKFCKTYGIAALLRFPIS